MNYRVASKYIKTPPKIDKAKFNSPVRSGSERVKGHHKWQKVL